MAYEPWSPSLTTPTPQELWYWSPRHATATTTTPSENRGNGNKSSRKQIKEPVTTTSSSAPSASRRTALTPLLLNGKRKLGGGNTGQRKLQTYHHNDQLGCAHYASNVALSAPCCNEFFVCRFCHDDKRGNSHRINRKEVNRLLCLGCDFVQVFDEDNPINNHSCHQCKTNFAHYFCHKCKLYDNDVQKEIFHCELCGICRVGVQSDFFHCTKCDCCLELSLKDKHKCVQHAMEGACPVCADDLGSSQLPVTLFETCGHMMHTACFHEYTKHKTICPICLKSLADLSDNNAYIDELVAKYSSALPAEYSRFQARILCGDCERGSLVKHHPKYHKCAHCGSYNTRVTGHERVGV